MGKVNQYLKGLDLLFKKYKIERVYAYCRFRSVPMRNPVLYVAKDISKEAKSEIVTYLREHSISGVASFNINTVVPPDINELVYLNGQFFTNDPWYVEV